MGLCDRPLSAIHNSLERSEMKHRSWPGFVFAIVVLLAAVGGCATPTLPPTATPETATIHVAPDGSGDYATLAEAVAAAPEGAIITLDAGTYRLAEPLSVEKALSLQGAGMEQTEIVSAVGEYVVRFAGEGPFAAEGIAFRHEGETGADVVLVEGGQVFVSRCHFAGDKGAGLHLTSRTTGTVRDSVAEVGRWAIGFSISGDAQPTLQNVRSTGNAYGIRVSDQAQPALQNNVCNDNNLDGIRYDDDAGGLARQNEASGNRTGIAVTGRAQPTLEENTTSDSKGAGIDFVDRAGGVARGNQIHDNFGGIGVAGQAQPTLEGNVISRNVTAGIAYFGNGGGTARRNESSGNGIDGIGVFADAAPTLEENVLQNNGESGISYNDSSGGVARNNECSGNKVGIQVNAEANPELDGNRSQENTQADIQDLRP